MHNERVRLAAGFVVVLAASLLAAAWGAFEDADRALLDTGFRLLRTYAPQPVERDVVLVGVDENTLRQMPEPPALWHAHLARFLEALARSRPAVVGLDMALPDKSYDFLVAGYDQRLLRGVAALRAVSSLVLAQDVDEHGKPVPLFPALVEAAGKDALGSVTLCADADRVVRWFDPSRCSQEDPSTSLAARMAGKLGVDQGWTGMIDYAVGDPVTYIPLQDVQRWAEQGDSARLSAAFQGKPVLLGVLSRAAERHPVPVALAAFEPQSRTLPPALIQVQALRSMMQRGFVQPVGAAMVWLLVAAASACWLGRSSLLKAFVVLVALIAALAGSTLALWQGAYLPGATLAVLALCAFGARLAYDARDMLRERRFLRNTFGSYVSPQILKEILRGRIRPEVAGTREKICVMFCGIRGFHSRVSSLPPEEAIDLLNDYFPGMTDAILRHGGTTNKFLGDGLLAFFGAPQALRNAEKSALEAAQDMLAALDELNARLRAQGKPPLSIGIGLHSGEAVVGHVGAESRREYTAIGEVVNSAMQLEELTKRLGPSILCSAQVADGVGRTGGLQDLGMHALDGLVPLHVFGWQPPGLRRSGAP